MSEYQLPDWMQSHLDRYLATDGKDGHIWKGLATLLLTTTGRKTGKPRQLPLLYGRAGGGYVIVASKAGHPRHPAWYRNLVANPAVEVQVGAERFSATARTAKGAERESLWRMMAEVFPNYNDYAAETGREIPVVVLERSDPTSVSEA